MLRLVPRALLNTFLARSTYGRHSAGNVLTTRSKTCSACVTASPAVLLDTGDLLVSGRVVIRRQVTTVRGDYSGTEAAQQVLLAQNTNALRPGKNRGIIAAMPTALTPQAFVAKWRPIELHERAMAQEHFIDLCRLLDHPTPAEADPSRTWYAFEAGATKATGGQGYADVWKRDYFAWEYKGGHADLDRAYGQLLLYSGALGNPPLLIVSDGQRFRIHTHFTHTVRVTYELTLDDLLQPAKLDLLRKAFTDPEALRSPVTTAQVTEQAATHFARIAQILRRYDHPAPAVAHFLIRLLFCLFAEDIGILPPDLFSRLVTRPGQNATTFMAQVRQLFAAMATGGFFGVETIKHVDGGLFNDDSVLLLDADSLRILAEVCGLNWSAIEPVILGTLFERGLDPDKRSQLGAHFTAKDDILLVVEPVLMAPLRREWVEIQAQVRLLADQLGALDEAADAERTAAARTQRRGKRTLLRGKALALLAAFREKLAAVQILDPACGAPRGALWIMPEPTHRERRVA